MATAPDSLVFNDDWSDLRRYRPLPEIDTDRMLAYRLERIRNELRGVDAAMCVLVSPISLRYAIDCSAYALFQSHVPTSYLFVPQEGPVVIHSVYGSPGMADEVRAGRPIAFFDAGDNLPDSAADLARDVSTYLSEIGTDNRRVAIEYVNPSITRALMRRGLEVTDGVAIVERARLIKSPEEIQCMKWSIAVAELGLEKMTEALRPGVTELQLWGLLNYTNLANNGNWHDGRMLASGPRTNPWLQEATQRPIENGDLVAVDTDMIGPWGYCADVSRTFHCGPARPTRRQKEIYRLAVDEIEHNLQLIKPGLALSEFRRHSYVPPEEFHEGAYPCIIHGVGLCDEYPRVDPVFRGVAHYDDTLQPGMVICVESFMGATGEREGVKLEQQVLITEDGYELLSNYPLEESLLS